MGNCLDIPPPPPKTRPVYYAKPRYYLGNHTPSIASGSLASGPSVYSSYQPYAAFGGPRPLVAIDPMTGQPYNYPMGVPMVTQPYYGDPMLRNSYAYYDDDVEREQRTSRRVRKHHRRERRHVNGGIPDRNANTEVKNNNVNSTLIETYPNPDDDVIRRGHEIITSRGVQRSLNGVISGSIQTTKTTKTMTTTEAAISGTSTEVTVSNNRVAQSPISAVPVATRGSTYVTYIEDEPPPPEPVQEITVEETTEVTVEETTHVQKDEHEEREEQVVTEIVEEEDEGGFKETGEADEGVIQLYIDEPLNSTKRVTEVTSSTVVSSESLRRVGMRYHPSVTAKDVVICYAPADFNAMLKIKRELQSAGLSVAVSSFNFENTNEDFVDWLLFPQAIIDAKMMVVLLSSESVKSRQLRDEVALATVTDTSIFPVAVGESLDILSSMDLGLKLQLASYQWTELAGEVRAEISIDFMVRSMQEEIEVIRSYEIIDEDYGEVSSWAQRRQKIVRQTQLKRYIALKSHMTAAQFWDKYYASGVMSIPWKVFYKDFKTEYKGALKSTIPQSCNPQLIDGLRRELLVDNEGMVHKAQFVEFCSESGTDQDLWERVRAVAREAQAIRDVFDVESTVRLVAIENIGTFGSPNVLSALRELLNDRDANIRAVAVMSLSRCMFPGDEETFQALFSKLDDGDRLVREAACLAMGHLLAKQAVEKLLHMWRNDVIAHVREAASAALNDIGGQEVEDAMRVTEALSDEFRHM